MCLHSNDALCLLTIYEDDDGSGKTDMPPFEVPPPTLSPSITVAVRLNFSFNEPAAICVCCELCRLGINIQVYPQYTHVHVCRYYVVKVHNKPTPYSTAARSAMKPS